MPRPPSSPSPPPPLIPLPTGTFGSFDYPPATTSPPPRPWGNGSYESIQQFLARREQERAATGTESEDASAPSPRRSRTEARRQLRARLNERDPLQSSRNTAPASRPRATPSERYLRRSEALRNERSNWYRDSTSDLMATLLPQPNDIGHTYRHNRHHSPAEDMEGSQRRTKRRKLEHDVDHPPPYSGFKYGYKGQVVPGRLKMEIVSCDGGEYRYEKHGNSAYGGYPIQNVLRNDKSVYCSERPRCNLLLKHIGEMPFTLEKVVIRAPDRGFTAPYVNVVHTFAV